MDEQIHYWSASTLAFYALAFKPRYMLAGSWPSDAVEVSDETFTLYGRTTAPDGKTLGVDDEKMPAWVDAPFVAVPAGKQYAAQLRKNLNVKCTNDASLNGAYKVSDTDVSDINDEVQFIVAHSEFSSGNATLQWANADGKAVEFKSVSSFMAFAKAVVKYVSACRAVRRTLADGAVAKWPNNSVKFSYE